MHRVAHRIATPADLQPAQALLNARYAFRGYGEHLIPTGQAYTTFVADRDGEIVATVTLELRGDEAWLIRLASSARSAAVLQGLFALAYSHGSATGAARDLWIEVHPRHVSFYRQAFGFEPIGEVHGCPPAQRMRIAVEAIDRLMRPALAA